MSGVALARAVDNGPRTIVLGVAACGVWAASAWFNGGFGTGAVAIEGIVLILVLALGLGVGRAGLVKPTGPRAVALAALAAFVAWTYASIAWAHVPGDAWVGAQKTLVYAVGFALFALFRYSPRSLERMLGVYVAALAVVAFAAIVQALHSPNSSFSEGRLQAPIGYINATVALWMLGFWPACHLMSRRGLPATARGASGAAAVVFAGLSVLGQSRSWIYVSVAVACLYLLVTPTRLRVLGAFAVVAAAIALTWSALLAVFEDADRGVVSGSAVRAALETLTVAALAAAVLTVAWVAADRRFTPSHRVTRAAASVAAAAAVLAVAAVAVRHHEPLHHPYAWATSKWRSFAQEEPAGGQSRTRFLAPLGSDRYQEWRIALSAFRERPVNGIGAENFADVYLVQRRDSLHEPSFPHSIPLGLLSQLGFVGVGLFVVFAAAALSAARRRLRGDAGAAAVAALMVPAYWFAHGSFDWFWEFPALAAPALGFLGLAASPLSDPTPPPRSSRPSARRRRVRPATFAAGAGALLAVTALLGLVATALADAYTTSAASSWRSDPAASYRMLDLAARLDPLSAKARLIGGSIALDRHEYERASRLLVDATRREPRNWYAWFQLALVDSARARWREARVDSTRTLRLNPRDPVVLLADHLIRAGRPFDGAALNALYLNTLRHRFGLSPNPS